MDKYYIGILPELNFRFLVTNCSNTIQEIIDKQGLKYSSADVVAKTTLGAFFLAAMVKDDANVSIQLEGNGEVERVLAYSDKYGKLRAVAHKKEVVASMSDPTLGIGTGVIKVNRWRGSIHDRQSLTELVDDSFENNLLQYIYQSEQVPSYLHTYLGNQDSKALVGGFIFQALPEATVEEKKLMQEKIQVFFAGIDDFFRGDLQETFSKLPDLLATELQVLQEGTPEYNCVCDMEKIKRIVRSMGREEADSIIQDVGKVELTCEFCVKKFSLDAEEVHLLFI